MFERNLAGIFRSRRDGRLLECNSALVHLLGFASRDEVLARNAKEFYADPADRERLMKLLQPGVVVSNHELQWRRADGTKIWVLINVREVVEGPAAYLEGIVLDITDRKRAQIGARTVGSWRAGRRASAVRPAPSGRQEALRGEEEALDGGTQLVHRRLELAAVADLTVRRLVRSPERPAPRRR